MPTVRPYHAGSLLGPAPSQVLDHEQQSQWISRVRSYWNRSNAKAGKVGAALLSFLGDDGALFPSLETIAAAAACSIRAVTRWIDRFVEVGFIRRIRRRNLFGQTSNAYLIRFPGDADAPARVQQLELSIYKDQQDSNEESSMDSLPAAGRPAALRRLNSWLGTVVQAVRSAPQAPRYTPEQQIALLMLQDRLALGG